MRAVPAQACRAAQGCAEQDQAIRFRYLPVTVQRVISMEADIWDIPAEVERAVEEMPAISPVLGKINQIAREMDTSPKDLVKIIMLDPVLTGKVLKLVNSSFYGLAQRVQSLAQAVVLLGMNTVKNLAISTALISAVFVKEKRSPIDPEAFWRHCLATAVGSKLLAIGLNCSAEDREMFFMAGLLHDVGKILFIRTDSKKYARALEESRQLGVSLTFAELSHFGCTHATAGGVLARKWKIDDGIIEVIEHHHGTHSHMGGRYTPQVVVANNLSKRTQAGESGNCVIEEASDDIADGLGVRKDMLSGISEQLTSELDKAAEFLNIVQDRRGL